MPSSNRIPTSDVLPEIALAPIPAMAKSTAWLSVSFFASLIAICLWISPSNAQEIPLPAEKPLILQGSAVVHAETLAPVEPQLQAGAEFDERALPKLQPNNDWYPIPSWYAGYKHMETQTILQDYNFATGQRANPNKTVLNRQDLPIGFQMDRNYQIWEFKRAPYTSTIDNGKTLSTTIVRSRDPLQVTQNNVVIRMVETSVVVDKRNRRILRTLQEEQINSFTPAGQGGMNLQTSIKSFGANGSPLIQETSVRTISQIAPFRPINNYQGMDMRSMFRDFMLARGYGNLLPPDLAPASPASTQEQRTLPMKDPANSPDSPPASNSFPQGTTDDTIITAPDAPPVAPSRVP